MRVKLARATGGPRRSPGFVTAVARSPTGSKGRYHESIRPEKWPGWRARVAEGRPRMLGGCRTRCPRDPSSRRRPGRLPLRERLPPRRSNARPPRRLCRHSPPSYLEGDGSTAVPVQIEATRVRSGLGFGNDAKPDPRVRSGRVRDGDGFADPLFLRDALAPPVIVPGRNAPRRRLGGYFLGVGGERRTNSFPSGSAITARVAVNPGGWIG